MNELNISKHNYLPTCRLTPHSYLGVINTVLKPTNNKHYFRKHVKLSPVFVPACLTMPAYTKATLETHFYLI